MSVSSAAGAATTMFTAPGAGSTKPQSNAAQGPVEAASSKATAHSDGGYAPAKTSGGVDKTA